MSLQQDIVNAGYVRVRSNSGVWKFIDFSAHDPNIAVLENMDSGKILRFAISSKGVSRVIPLTKEEMVKGNITPQNVTATIVDDVQLFDDKPKKVNKRRGRPRKNDSSS